jgi:hypothetical protein
MQFIKYNVMHITECITTHRIQLNGKNTLDSVYTKQHASIKLDPSLENYIDVGCIAKYKYNLF